MDAAVSIVYNHSTSIAGRNCNKKNNSAKDIVCWVMFYTKVTVILRKSKCPRTQNTFTDALVGCALVARSGSVWLQKLFFCTLLQYNLLFVGV